MTASVQWNTTIGYNFASFHLTRRKMDTPRQTFVVTALLEYKHIKKTVFSTVSCPQIEVRLLCVPQSWRQKCNKQYITIVSLWLMR